VNVGIQYPHRLKIIRDLAVIYDGKADVQDAGAAIPRNMTGQPGVEAEATAFLAGSGIGIEQYDEAEVYTEDGRVKYGEVSYFREMDDVVLLRLDEFGLRHTVVLETPVVVEQPGARFVVTGWDDEDPQPGRLTAVGGVDTEQAGKPADASEYILTLRSDAIVSPGQRAYVTAHEDDDPTKPVIWSRFVSIVDVELPTRAKDRRQSVLAMDITDLTP
jgi:hypothetical protein